MLDSLDRPVDHVVLRTDDPDREPAPPDRNEPDAHPLAPDGFTGRAAAHPNLPADHHVDADITESAAADESNTEEGTR